MQLEIEEAALSKETDKLAMEHLSEIRSELSSLRDDFKEMKANGKTKKRA